MEFKLQAYWLQRKSQAYLLSSTELPPKSYHSLVSGLKSPENLKKLQCIDLSFCWVICVSSSPLSSVLCSRVILTANNFYLSKFFSRSYCHKIYCCLLIYMIYYNYSRSVYIHVFNFIYSCFISYSWLFNYHIMIF